MCNEPVAGLHAVLASRTALMRHHAPQRVQGYCRTCEKFGVFWSCPPFPESPLSTFPEWTHAVIVCQQTWLEPTTTRDQLLERFLNSRVAFGKLVRHLEGRTGRVTGLVAGHCSGCDECTRSGGEPCRAPSRLRYSLEAVGFDVTALVEDLAGLKVHWPKSGLPDYLTTVGALLCPTEEAAELCAAAARTAP